MEHIDLHVNQSNNLQVCSFTLGTYRQTHEKYFFAGDFNTEVTEPVLAEFLVNYDCKHLAKDKNCLKSPENPRCIDLSITKSIISFQKQQQ